MDRHRSTDSHLNRSGNYKRTSRNKGFRGEKFASEYLEESGYIIHAKNYSKRICEIDIVAEKDQSIYFIEVKVQTSKQSYSFDQYFHKNKLNKIRICSEIWLLENGFGADTKASIKGLFLRECENSFDIVSFTTIGV